MNLNTYNVISEPKTGRLEESGRGIQGAEEEMEVRFVCWPQDGRPGSAPTALLDVDSHASCSSIAEGDSPSRPPSHLHSSSRSLSLQDAETGDTPTYGHTSQQQQVPSRFVPVSGRNVGRVSLGSDGPVYLE